MKISRHNYEEWFILYMDDELGSEDRREVELFIEENPDLRSELDLLMQSKLSPDLSEVFPDRTQLLKPVGSEAIALDNYEGWFVSYIDDELNAEEKKSVHQFLASHPEKKAELDLLQKTKLQPETISFPDKSLLYRREEKVRVVYINWRRIAIAASLLLAVGTTAVLLSKQQDKEPNSIAEQNPGTIVTPVTKNNQPENNPVALQHNQATKEESAQEEAQNVVQSKDDDNRNNNVSATVVEKTEKKLQEQQAAEKNIDKPVQPNNRNELPEPIYNPNVIKPSVQDNPIAKVENVPVTNSLTNPKQNNPAMDVTLTKPEPLYTANTSTEIYEPVDAGQTGKKNKLRGFFRKITRTFEKNTNIKATDDEDRLLLGGLAIQL